MQFLRRRKRRVTSLDLPSGLSVRRSMARMRSEAVLAVAVWEGGYAL
jgi:hypothetical protein